MLGADQHEVGFHIARENRSAIGREGRQQQCDDAGDHDNDKKGDEALHRASFGTLAGRRLTALDQQIDIGGEQPVGVEVMVALEQRAPQDRHQHRRHEQLRIVAQGCRLELAALDAAIDEARHRLEPARDDVLVIELR